MLSIVAFGVALLLECPAPHLLKRLPPHLKTLTNQLC